VTPGLASLLGKISLTRLIVIWIDLGYILLEDAIVYNLGFNIDDILTNISNGNLILYKPIISYKLIILSLIYSLKSFFPLTEAKYNKCLVSSLFSQ